MSADPLDQLRRPATAHRPAETNGATSPVAPVWRGDCLRLAGEASAPTLIFRQRGGKHTALAYGYMTAVRLDGNQLIEIDYVSYAVSLSGRRLKTVFDALAYCRALELVEAGGDFETDENDPYIETISIIPTQDR